MKVWRGDASGGEFVEFAVPSDPGMVVLDVVHRIQATHAPDLAVRWNCKAGKCGSCSAEVNGHPKLMCMTRMNEFAPGEEIAVSPVKTFPVIKDLVTDVSFNYEKAKTVPAFKPKPKDPDGKRRMYQEDVERVQEFHEENKKSFSGPRFFVRLAALEMHPLDTNERIDLIREKHGLGFCNITKCCTEVCPEDIHITDNAIIPLKERVVSAHYDPVAWALRRIRRTGPASPAPSGPQSKACRHRFVDRDAEAIRLLVVPAAEIDAVGEEDDGEVELWIDPQRRAGETGVPVGVDAEVATDHRPVRRAERQADAAPHVALLHALRPCGPGEVVADDRAVAEHPRDGRDVRRRAE
jgi:succinate dehydrogenase / fumarate reductase iron-sulfur subunit